MTGRVPARDGATFILDEEEDFDARWGHGSEVLWAQGESLMIAGVPGVGKTTIAGQLVAGLIGVIPSFLGYPIKPAKRVLYLAMDRPKQVRRAMRRYFNGEHREALKNRLVVRPGPLPMDLAKNPQMLLQLALLYDCDAVVIDSLKDAAVKLTDDEAAGNVNRAIQLCNANNVDVLALHHTRKSEAGSRGPTSLADIYGSTWITAGAGSVLLLHGQPGAEKVELIHVKQPAETVGPLKLAHDHPRGVTTVIGDFDAVAYIASQRTAGATIAEIAHAQWGTPQASNSANYKATSRRIKTLVEAGVVECCGEEGRKGGGTFAAQRYRVVKQPDVPSLLPGFDPEVPF